MREPTNSSTSSRRDFLKTSAALTGTAALSIPPHAHAAGSDVIKIGLIGCGGRGTEAANNAMNAGKDVRLVAMADIFRERLDASRERLKKVKPEQVEVSDERCFLGFDAYQRVIECADVVLITPSSHFNPPILQAAIAAGKHVFCEKPHGIDVPGLKMEMAAAAEAKTKGLSLVSGLCWRHDPGVRETMKRVLDGAIGEILAIQENYVSQPYGLNATQARPVRDGVPALELVPLQLAVRRPDRPAARAQPG